VGLPPGFDIDAAASLGLQLVALFVDQMHGSLRVGPGPGACFELPSRPLGDKSGEPNERSDRRGRAGHRLPLEIATRGPGLPGGRVRFERRRGGGEGRRAAPGSRAHGHPPGRGHGRDQGGGPDPRRLSHPGGVLDRLRRGRDLAAGPGEPALRVSGQTRRGARAARHPADGAFPPRGRGRRHRTRQGAPAASPRYGRARGLGVGYR
jgi:hypothetical protein